MITERCVATGRQLGIITAEQDGRSLTRRNITDFFERNDTISLGVCNGCQLFIELGLINKEHSVKPKMEYNDSNKFECVFSSVDIIPSPSIMLRGLEGCRLGVWSAHGEGKFDLPYSENKYSIAVSYTHLTLPTILLV